MKMRLLLFLFLPFFVSCSASKRSADFNLRAYKEVRLSNGLRVLLVEDKSLPSFSLSLLIRSGSSADPEGKSGLSSLVASLLSKGTEKRSATEIADSFGQIGSDFEESVEKDYSFLSASSLSFHKEKLIEDFAEVLTAPAFKSAEINRRRKAVLSQLQKTVDEPSTFAAVNFSTYLYGSHPYARRSLGANNEVQSIKRKDVIQHYFRHYRPNNAILAVVGDFGPNIQKQLEDKFKNWKSRQLDPVIFPEIPKIAGVQIRLVTKRDLKQSQVRLGHQGIRRDNPEYLPLRVANTILGGAFASRLMSEIRIKRGLTYGISSGFEAMRSEGPFLISSSTRHEKVGELLIESLGVLKLFRKEGVTDEEVNNAKALLSGSFPRVLETAEVTARSLLVLRYYDIPDTYLTTYLSKINSISKSDVNSAIKKYFDPENIKILVYSPKDAVIDQLRPIGTVQVKDYKELM